MISGEKEEGWLVSQLASQAPCRQVHLKEVYGKLFSCTEFFFPCNEVMVPATVEWSFDTESYMHATLASSLI